MIAGGCGGRRYLNKCYTISSSSLRKVGKVEKLRYFRFLLYESAILEEAHLSFSWSGGNVGGAVNEKVKSRGVCGWGLAVLDSAVT